MSDSKRDVAAGVVRLADFLKKEEHKRKAAMGLQAVALARYKAERDRFAAAPLQSVSNFHEPDDEHVDYPIALESDSAEASQPETHTGVDEFSNPDQTDTNSYSDTPFSDEVLADFSEEED